MTLSLPEKVKTYWQVNVAFLRESVAVGRGWWLARAADLATFDGRGYLDLADYRAAMCEIWGVWTWRHLRDVLTDGEELGVWSVDHGDTLRLIGMAAAAATLGIGKLRGRPVYIPTAALLEGAQLAAAHFYASVESARPRDGRRRRGEPTPGPMSRRKLEELTGVPPSTQRMYDALLERERERNIVVTDTPWTPENVQNAAWARGHNLFAFTDHDGRRGPAGQRYIAFELPATRAAVHEHAPRGRQKKVNARLNLVMQGGQDTEPDVHYHPNATAATAAAGRLPDVTHYYIDNRQCVPDAGRPARLQYVNIWGMVP